MAERRWLSVEVSERVNSYQDEAAMRAAVEAGNARAVIGGHWEAIGALQFQHLCRHGLEPQHRLIDLGCGALRGGVHFVPYLDAGNYFGIDVSAALLAAGRGELEAVDCAARVPPENLRVTGTFDLSGFPLFDFGIAQSLFTHLPRRLVVACLASARDRFAPRGKLFATFFVASLEEVQHTHPTGVVTYTDRDPFHYSAEQIGEFAAQAGWEVASLSPWGHPHHQSMCEMRPYEGASAVLGGVA